MGFRQRSEGTQSGCGLGVPCFEKHRDPDMTADGDWDLVVMTPLGERRGVLSLRTEGKILHGRQMADGKFDRDF